MAFCSKCGTEVAAGAVFCAKCGAAQSGGAPVIPTSEIAQPGLAENVAGCLCYLFGWVSGLIFFLIDKRPFVRFHAAQSMVVFAGLGVLYYVIGTLFRGNLIFMGGFGALGLIGMVFGLIWLAGVVLWILLMVKAYQGEKFEVPIAAGIAKSFSGN
jgi:uncharacterized membrane protein